jgi:ATP-dependent Lon protease
MSTIQRVPDTLAVIPLNSKVLLPSVVTKVIVNGDAAAYIARVLKVVRKDRSKQPTYLAIVPVCKSASEKTLKTSINVNFEADGDSETVVKTDKFTIKSTIESDKNDPNAGLNLFHFGCAARVIQVEKSEASKDSLTLYLQGICRFHIENLSNSENVLMAHVTHFPEPLDMSAPKHDQEFNDTLLEFRSLSREFMNKMKDLKIPGALLAQLSKIIDKSPPSQLANLLASVIETTFDEKLEILEATELKDRLKRLNEWMTRQLHVLKITQQIQSNIDGKLDKKRREFYLRQQVSILLGQAIQSHDVGINTHLYSLVECD